MNSGRIGPVLLQTRLTLMRFGWGNLVALLLCAFGAVAWFGGVRYLRLQERAQLQALTRAQQALQSPRLDQAVATRSTDEIRLAQFYDALGANGFAEQQVKTLFALADKSGLVLKQADYKLTDNKEGHYQRYQIVMPIHGPYRAIRQFCEQALLAIPFASLDQIDFRRDAIGTANLEARLRLTLYLGATPRQVAAPVIGTVQEHQE